MPVPQPELTLRAATAPASAIPRDVRPDADVGQRVKSADVDRSVIAARRYLMAADAQESVPAPAPLEY